MPPGLEWLSGEVIIKGLSLALIWFFGRTLKRIDDNQKLLFERLTRQGEQLAKLWGEHRGRTSKGS